MTTTRRPSDPKGTGSLSLSHPESGSHLAHWPPPTMSRELKPMPVKHRSSEPVKHATRRGWRLTRAMFAEFQDDEG
ncbi:MAG: hypothetical protein E6614_01865 [Bradyrhizobium sp.]|jgi:hypothetical protein|uniref:Uncharacterized protein n=1 Tax=Bradyrhizobium denitrificans TaxID=2734912 RepID=A0ABS5G6E5_9BRAD|nr:MULTISPECIES: hypothetical protein [Bradyrhizobium]RTM02576.1 MAG: hypothetical protein EKK32_10575 [Bradyrhizobiaceae bacterium]ABQ36228.1 hypothetical protein BBta_4167 [Bradyrhizobium sp. BTAi1]MBR1136892.1 hypothetical protein [Bradyrhizobium denitrificans]MCL8488898.1 hypothetical protein [Bradyrhizobium denitrificans]MDU0957628.1 hypothetical protein [Bradyrhizobium sp.]